MYEYTDSRLSAPTRTKGKLQRAAISTLPEDEAE
jgi:hypothetical protein